MKNLSCGIIAQPNSSFSVIYSNYCLRNGGFTTTAFSLRPRMSMQISVPTLLVFGPDIPHSDTNLAGRRHSSGGNHTDGKYRLYYTARNHDGGYRGLSFQIPPTYG